MSVDRTTFRDVECPVTSPDGGRKRLRKLYGAAALAVVLSLTAGFPAHTLAQAAQASAGEPHLLSSDELQKTFPQTVFFQGQSAPLQLRNSAAIRFAGGGIFFAGLVDASGYASSVQEKYQMYLICERPVLIGGKQLQAGAYGAGFVGERFLVMDIGGRTIAEGQTQTDAQMTRPRPLQLLQTGKSGAKLYLGKRWVSVELGK